MPSTVLNFAGGLLICLVGVLVVIGGGYGLYGLQQWLLGQGAPLWLAVAVPLALFLTLATWAYWRTFQIMQRF